MRTIITGRWETSTSYETTGNDTHIAVVGTGMIEFKADGTMIDEGDNLMTFTVPEGELAINYHAVVHGEWALDGQRLRLTRLSEEITGRDEISERFITSEKMVKLRAESATQFTLKFKRISRT
ncbi:MAG: hypothetical protein KDM63_13475, partial [Verrucomicrobiae bacterium]|nr:hypothetical protein [Verrucomicrobiae bacterium]